MPTINTSNYTIGGVDLYFEATPRHRKLAWSLPTETGGVGASFRADASRNLGNISVGEFAPGVTYLEHFFTAPDGTKRKDHIITQQKAMTIPFTFDEVNATNLKKFFSGKSLTDASLPASAIPSFRVMTQTLQRGCAQIRLRTDVGRDVVYMIPKCLIRSEGNISFNQESWWEAPMVLEVLYDNLWTASRLTGSLHGTRHWSNPASAICASAPYGVICMGAIDT